MKQVASDNGMTPVLPQTQAPAGDVGGLIAAVESKMSELMAWHAQQVRQLEIDKTVLGAQADQQREALLAKRSEIEAHCKLVNERVEQVNHQRVKLVELTSKLRAEEAALSREWADVYREREAVQRQADELTSQRKRIDERARVWLDETAEELSTPLKLTDAPEPTEEIEVIDQQNAA